MSLMPGLIAASPEKRQQSRPAFEEMSMRRLFVVLALGLSACATAAPVLDKRAAAEEVFRLSGGLEDLKLMARYAPLLVEGEDVKASCVQSLGRNPNALSALACDMVEGIVKGMASGQGGLQRALESQITRMESHAVDAMVETYTPGELAAMRRYYASPEGRAIVAKRAEYLSRLVGAR
jgi:hypothetical protein